MINKWTTMITRWEAIATEFTRGWESSSGGDLPFASDGGEAVYFAININ